MRLLFLEHCVESHVCITESSNPLAFRAVVRSDGEAAVEVVG